MHAQRFASDWTMSDPQDDGAISRANEALAARRLSVNGSQLQLLAASAARPVSLGHSPVFDRILSSVHVDSSRVWGVDFARLIAEFVTELRERCKVRGLDPSGDVASALFEFEASPEWQRLRESIDDSDVRLVIISGKSGVGKSVAAARMIIDAPMRGLHMPRYVSMSRLLETLSHPYDEERRSFRERLEQASAIVVDRVELGLLSAEEARLIVNFLCLRSAARRLTILTTEADRVVTGLGKLAQVPREDLQDRLGRYGAELHLTGPSRRKSAMKGGAR